MEKSSCNFIKTELHHWPFPRKLPTSFNQIFSQIQLRTLISQIIIASEGQLSKCNRKSTVIAFRIIISSRLSDPPWNIDLTAFYLGPPKSSKSVRPHAPFVSTPLKILENLTSPMKCTLVQKRKDTFFKETKVLDFKFSGLKWFLVFEDLYNREGSLRRNKTSKTLEFRLKTVNNFKTTVNFFNLLSFKKKEKRKKKTCSKSGKLYFYYSTRKHDDLITTYFPFCRR